MLEQAAAEDGMYLRDLLSDADFARRTGKTRDFQQPFEALSRLMRVFAERPDDVLQELVEIAVACCGADSAGISLEEPDEAGAPTFRWVAISGSFSKYLQGRTPRFFSPCGTCLNSGRPQLYQVTKPYYDFLGVIAEPITDGILIPWETEGFRGTIWAVAHQREEAFDLHDYRLLKSLADFIAITMRQKKVDDIARNAAKAEASAERAHKMAHQINNPLQKLTNTIFLARQGGPDADVYLDTAVSELHVLSEKVRSLLALKYHED
jgi:hypothetical protein